MPQPTKIPQSWAGQGDYNVIPDTQLNTGMCSWQLGFPPETQDPLAAGGVPPNRQDMNGALNWLSLFAMWQQQGGLWEYDALTDFEPPALVVESDVLYWCMSANGPSGTVKAPSADSAGTYWKKLVNADGSLNVPVIGNATTTARGIVELATSAETKALTDSQRAVTPDSLNGLLSLSPVALTVPKADSSAKLTGWLDALKGGDGRVNISINGTAPKLQTARTVRVNLGSTSAASFDGSVNITPGVNGTLAVGNGGTGQTNLDLVTVGKAKQLNTARSIRTNLGSTSAVNFDGTTNITPGVTGTLPVANGGTGQTNLDNVTVGKAKALNTARAINGTNFNGTADITTAKWGTARNVTIKDATQTNTSAAVSVNGSAAFSLLLPATIKATLTGNADSANIWKTARSFTIKDATSAHSGTAVSVNGSAAVNLFLPTTITATLNGNADSATKLKTARTINGTAFDGTANIIAMESSERYLGQIGYIKFQSGLIIQWGQNGFDSGVKYKDISLPVAFTVGCFIAMAGDSITASTTSVSAPFTISWSIGASTLSTIRFVTDKTDTGVFTWLAIGR